MEQILALIRQNPFFSAVSVIGTAVSITFVMVIYMVYDIQTADLAPESHRSSMVYSSYGYSYRKSDHSNSNTGMSYRAVNAIFAELPGAELVTYLGPTYLRYCGDSPVRGMRRTVRQVDLNYWRVYDIPLVAGRLFSTEEFDACRDVVVIGEQLAREAFGSAEAAIGKNYFVNFRPKRIVVVFTNIFPNPCEKGKQNRWLWNQLRHLKQHKQRQIGLRRQFVHGRSMMLFSENHAEEGRGHPLSGIER